MGWSKERKTKELKKKLNFFFVSGGEVPPRRRAVAQILENPAKRNEFETLSVKLQKLFAPMLSSEYDQFVFLL